VGSAAYLEPFPVPVLTLDALHLASAEFLRSRGQRLELPSWTESSPSPMNGLLREAAVRIAESRANSFNLHPTAACHAAVSDGTSQPGNRRTSASAR
jgi:hypothetical protein